MILKKFDAWIFDQDGVIADSEKYHIEAEQETCAHFGIVVPQEEWGGSNFTGRTSRAIFEHIARKFGNGTAAVEDLLDCKRKLYLELLRTELESIPGAIRFVQRLWARGKKIALVTSSERIIQRAVFEKFGISRYFDAVITADDVTHGKPHPEPYSLALEKLGVSGSRAVVIEDSTNGIQSAKAAGCTVIGITTSFPAKTLESAGADYIIDEFDQLTLH